MKRTVLLCEIAFLISTVAFIGLIGSAKALNMDEDDQWNGYAHAYVRGSWLRLGYPYYRVYHEADNTSPSTWGTYEFYDYGKYGNILYQETGSIGPGGHKETSPPLYYQIWAAETITIVSPYTAHAVIGPPGWV